MQQFNRSVRLEQMIDAHVSNTCRWLGQSDELRRQIDCLDVPTAEGNRDYWQLRWQDRSREDYAIVTSTGLHIGNCGLCDIDLRRKKAQLWIYLAESQGNGCGTSAVRQLLVRAFGELGLNRIFLRVVADNRNAVRFYQRFGFVMEGCARQDTIRDGRYVDSFWMALLEQDYRDHGKDSRNDL
jgi:RimJ/RimL family protein N-acetyltransferase